MLMDRSEDQASPAANPIGALIKAARSNRPMLALREPGLCERASPIAFNCRCDSSPSNCGKDTCVIMEPGIVWYLRLSDPHSVINNGISDRMHLVIDAAVNDWLTTHIKHASLPPET
jgi:hypothetical protein